MYTESGGRFTLMRATVCVISRSDDVFEMAKSARALAQLHPGEAFTVWDGARLLNSYRVIYKLVVE